MTKRMFEMIMCFMEQGLNEVPWGVTLEEYMWLKELIE